MFASEASNVYKNMCFRSKKLRFIHKMKLTSLVQLFSNLQNELLHKMKRQFSFCSSEKCAK